MIINGPKYSQMVKQWLQNNHKMKKVQKCGVRYFGSLMPYPCTVKIYLHMSYHSGCGEARTHASASLFTF